MTIDVVSVREHTRYRTIVNVLATRQVSAVPVIDGYDHVVGVVSEADLLRKIEFTGDEEERHLFERRSRRSARAKAYGDVASSLMSAPAITINPDTTVVAAAKLMDAEQVKRLPVVDAGGRLLGIVARSDLLKTYLRPDPDIRDDVVDDVLRGGLLVDPMAVEVDVADGVVTLRGRVDRRTTAAIAVRLTAGVPGVIDVVDQLTWEFDDIEVTEAGYRSHPSSTSVRQSE
jgi:CBS-domain-containing membrane protein